jgi:hypothetical protein
LTAVNSRLLGLAAVFLAAAGCGLAVRFTDFLAGAGAERRTGFAARFGALFFAGFRAAFLAALLDLAGAFFVVFLAGFLAPRLRSGPP